MCFLATNYETFLENGYTASTNSSNLYFFPNIIDMILKWLLFYSNKIKQILKKYWYIWRHLFQFMVESCTFYGDITKFLTSKFVLYLLLYLTAVELISSKIRWTFKYVEHKIGVKWDNMFFQNL